MKHCYFFFFSRVYRHCVRDEHDITSDVHWIKTWQKVTIWDDTAQLNQYRASVKRPRSVNELLCSVKPLNRSQKVISRLSLHALIDSDHLPEGKRSNILNWRAGAPCDVPLPLWWRSIKRAAAGFSAAAALVMESWHTTARAHTLKRWKATISVLLRMFQEVKALRCFLQDSRKWNPEIGFMVRTILRSQFIFKLNILYLDDMGGTRVEQWLKRPQLWGHLYPKLGQIGQNVYKSPFAHFYVFICLFVLFLEVI